MTFNEWWADPNTGMPFPETGADLQEWCHQAFMAGVDAANTSPHRAMFDEGIVVGKVMAAKWILHEIKHHTSALGIDCAIRAKFGIGI